jgi:hypothetical protein
VYVALRTQGVFATGEHGGVVKRHPTPCRPLLFSQTRGTPRRRYSVRRPQTARMPSGEPTQLRCIYRAAPSNGFCALVLWCSSATTLIDQGGSGTWSRKFTMNASFFFAEKDNRCAVIACVRRVNIDLSISMMSALQRPRLRGKRHMAGKSLDFRQLRLDSTPELSRHSVADSRLQIVVGDLLSESSFRWKAQVPVLCHSPPVVGSRQGDR